MSDYSFRPELSKKAQMYFDRVQPEIRYCLTCQPYDEGEAVWILGERVQLAALLDNFKVPKKYRDEICSNLCCQGCGRESFEEYEDIGIEDKVDRSISLHIKKAKKQYGREILSFNEYIKETPFLASQHSLGKKISREIEQGSLPISTVHGKYFRSRLVKSHIAFEHKDLFVAPVGQSLDGRFNHAGQSHYYLSKEKETSIKECIQDETESQLLWVQEIEIKEQISEIIDLTYEWEELGPTTNTLLVALHTAKVLERSKQGIHNWQPDYFITRFLMDCIKRAGYNGIKYNSVKDYKGENIVLFNPEKFKIDFIGKPKVIIYEHEINPKQRDYII